VRPWFAVPLPLKTVKNAGGISFARHNADMTFTHSSGLGARLVLICLLLLAAQPGWAMAEYAGLGDVAAQDSHCDTSGEPAADALPQEHGERGCSSCLPQVCGHCAVFLAALDPLETMLPFPCHGRDSGGVSTAFTPPPLDGPYRPPAP